MSYLWCQPCSSERPSQHRPWFSPPCRTELLVWRENHWLSAAREATTSEGVASGDVAPCEKSPWGHYNQEKTSTGYMDNICWTWIFPSFFFLWISTKDVGKKRLISRTLKIQRENSWLIKYLTIIDERLHPRMHFQQSWVIRNPDAIKVWSWMGL